MSLLSPQLEAFIAITQAKTVHGAAAVLHMTQTAVTQRIRSLEAKLGTTLFVRTRRGMMLTPEGEALLRYCHAVREMEGEALAIIHTAAINTPVRICMTGPTSIMTSRVIPQCVPVMRHFKNLLMQYDINDLEIREKALRVGDAQFAILQQENLAPEMEYKILKPERYVLVCTADWKNRKVKDILKKERIIDYDSTDKMSFNYLKHFELFDNVNHDRHFVNRTDSLATLLCNGFGYGVLTTEFSEPYVQNKQLMILNKGKIFENNMVLAWYARHEAPAYFAAIVDAIS